jgi:carbohydrate kinase of FGGY family protein
VQKYNMKNQDVSTLDTLLLGIDVGTTAAKAALFSIDGHLQGVGQAEYPVHHVRPGWVEQNPEDWWQAVCVAIQQAWMESTHYRTGEKALLSFNLVQGAGAFRPDGYQLCPDRQYMFRPDRDL